MEITCYDKYGRVIEKIVQWDVGQSISIKGYDLTSYAPQIHFANANSEKALVVESVFSGGLLSCQVPNSLARENLPIIMYIYDAVGETGKTNTIIKIPVTPRPMPDDVVYTDDVGVISLTEVLRQAREYMNNSLNYSTKAKGSEEKAKTSADAAKVSEMNAAKSESTASSSATQAAQSAKEAKAYVGSPLVANTVSTMTDRTKVYVYTGSESGYTAGNWYYHNGSAWVSGGVYNSSAVNVDKTLTQDGYAADAKVTGDAVSSLKEELDEMAIVVGTDISQIRATTTAPWAKTIVLENITLKKGYEYEFSIVGNGNERRYLALCKNDGTILKSYNYIVDGSFEYSASELLEGCYLDYRSDAKGHSAIISYKLKYPTMRNDMAEMRNNLTKMQNDMTEIRNSMTQYVDIIISDIYAVVGDTIQIFWKSFIDADLDNLIVKCLCNKGKNYPRYWEYTPTVSDVGATELTISVYAKNGVEIASKTVTLKTVLASNPTTKKNILCVGDSTMQGGYIPIEASRRIKGTTGVATTPQPLALTNIDFVGRMKNKTNTVGWEGTGGWTYVNYIGKGSNAVRFTISNATDLNITDVYEVNGFKFNIAEINITNGNGNIRCLFHYTTPYTSTWDTTEQTGTLTKVNGNGQISVVFDSWARENYQPFWNNTTNKFDIISYMNEYCDGKIDTICVLLGANSVLGIAAFADADVGINAAKTFFNNVHEQIPNCKILASTVPLPSPNGGIAFNYGASTESGAYNSNGFNHKMFTFNKSLIEIADSEDYKSFVTVVSSHAQFDAVNGYSTTSKALNTRTTETEKLQTNALHPSNSGYWQISDALAFRAVLCNLD